MLLWAKRERERERDPERLISSRCSQNHRKATQNPRAQLLESWHVKQWCGLRHASQSTAKQRRDILQGFQTAAWLKSGIKNHAKAKPTRLEFLGMRQEMAQFFAILQVLRSRQNVYLELTFNPKSIDMTTHGVREMPMTNP